MPLSTGEYKVPLEQLERDARVPRDAQIELAEQIEIPAPDPRGPQPDRDWFAAGG